MKTKFAFVFFVFALVLAACGAPATPVAEPTSMPEPTAMPKPTEAPAAKTIVDIAAADARFSTLVTAVKTAGLVETLSGKGPFTVFAPTNDAFAALPQGTLENLLKPENKQQLTDILLYHVVPGKVMASDVTAMNGKMADTALKGKQVGIKVDMGSVYLNEKTKVVTTDIEASNGVIHVIDSVLLPPSDAAATDKKDIVDAAIADKRFSTLVEAVQAAGLVDTLKGDGPFTVFAPTNDAFAALPAGTLESLLKPENKQQLTDILLYHVVPGKVMASDVASLNGKMADTALMGKQIAIKTDMGNVYLNDKVKVTTTDIEAANGVIHVIDAVLLPPAGGTASMDQKDIVDTAIADGRFKTLVAAVQAAGLVDTLKGEGPFTVFAPTDDAFSALPAGTVDNLLKPENKQQLIDILTYHVVSGKVMAADVTGLTSAKTVLGKDINIKVQDGKVMLNDKVQVILTDIETSNGVIHVIDGVLLPPQ